MRERQDSMTAVGYWQLWLLAAMERHRAREDWQRWQSLFERFPSADKPVEPQP